MRVSLVENYRLGGYNSLEYASSQANSLGQQHQANTAYNAHTAYHQQEAQQHSTNHPCILNHDAVSPVGSNRVPINQVPGRPRRETDPHVAIDMNGHHRLSHVGYGTGASSISPLYGNTSPPAPCGQTSYGSYGSNKRSRTDDLDLSMGVVDHSQLAGVQAAAVYPTPTANSPGHQTPGQVTSGDALTPLQPQHLLHHHHSLPNSASSTMSHNERNGAPCVVGQDGMPQPAAQPRAPKLRFMAEDDDLIIQLKEQKSLRWRQIADFFPGRTQGTLQVRYCTKLKAKTTVWNDDMDRKLKKFLEDYENDKWRVMAHKLGSGFTAATCRERAAQLAGEMPEEEQEPSPSPKAASLPESMELGHGQPHQRPWWQEQERAGESRARSDMVDMSSA